MDLQSAIAVSMLSVSRSKAAAALKGLQPDCPRMLSSVLEACGVPGTCHAGYVAEARSRATRALEEAKQLGIEPIALGDEKYPALLACTHDPPPVLWTLGDPSVLHRPTVAIVGSRAATPYAREVAAVLAGGLAGRGIVVASGLARGADSAAHRGCLEAGGWTIAVLGSGLNRVYPSEHCGLAANIRKQGILVSELGPDAAPLPEHFPLRNRIISGISLGVVVVEASEKSGSLITARYALEQGRDVMAVPGSVLSGRNRGSHSLLKDGAKVVETVDDILEELGWPDAAGPRLDSAKSLNSDRLVSSMDPGEPYGLDELIEATGLPATRLLRRLMDLQLAGVISRLGCGRFVRGPLR
jgi:DNA processing protein